MPQWLSGESVKRAFRSGSITSIAAGPTRWFVRADW